MNCYYENKNGKLYCANFLDIAKTLPEKSQQLIIADPPYYRVKGDFDFVWKDFDAYLKDVGKWAIACKRILADNGTLFWYGDDKNIAYSQVILDKYFGLVNSLVWYKYNLRGGMFGSTGGDIIRSFPICTERILMYSSEKSLNKCTTIDKKQFASIYKKIKETATKEDFIRCLLNLKIASSKESAKVLASYKLGTHKTRFDFLSKEMYNYIDNFNYKYEDLRKEYEDLQRPFYNTLKLNEILQYNTELNDHDHDTVKPETLTQALIITCSRKGDNVFIPFVGSGTECVVSEKENRKWIGCEIEQKHCKTSKNRIEKAREQFLFNFT